MYKGQTSEVFRLDAHSVSKRNLTVDDLIILHECWCFAIHVRWLERTCFTLEIPRLEIILCPDRCRIPLLVMTWCLPQSCCKGNCLTKATGISTIQSQLLRLSFPMSICFTSAVNKIWSHGQMLWVKLQGSPFIPFLSLAWHHHQHSNYWFRDGICENENHWLADNDRPILAASSRIG